MSTRRASTNAINQLFAGIGFLNQPTPAAGSEMAITTNFLTLNPLFSQMMLTTYQQWNPTEAARNKLLDMMLTGHPKRVTFFRGSHGTAISQFMLRTIVENQLPPERRFLMIIRGQSESGQPVKIYRTIEQTNMALLLSLAAAALTQSLSLIHI